MGTITNIAEYQHLEGGLRTRITKKKITRKCLIEISWDNGSKLLLIDGYDQFQILDE
jgi:hypothetical protein